MAWTDERVTRLKELWADGLSASQIAAQLGGVERNAVVGKVHRLGLAGRRTATIAAGAAAGGRARSAAIRASAVAPLRPAASRNPRNNNPFGWGNTKAKAPPPRQPAPPAPPAEPPPAVSLMLNLEELTLRSCRWPIGDPGAESFRFCGAEGASFPERPYCLLHIRMAYQPVGSRSVRPEKRAEAVA